MADATNAVTDVDGLALLPLCANLRGVLPW